MAWLTVSEAAERLNISEAAVRKRMQRNTLKHTKWQNGRVYVYMPGQEDADQDKEVQGSEHSDDKQRRPWWDIIAGVSGLVVVLGLMVYVLGLFTLWAPIVRTYTHDAATAWYAVSLVPRPVVAGLGTRQLIAFPLFATTTIVTLFSAVYILLLVLFPRAFSSRSGRSPSDNADEGSEARREERLRFRMASYAAVPVYGLVVLYGGWRIAANFAPLLTVPQWRLALSLGLLLLCALFAIVMLIMFILLLVEKEEGVPFGLPLLMLIPCGFLLALSYWTLPSDVGPSSLLQELGTAGADNITDAVIVSVATLIVVFIAPAALGQLFIHPLDRRRHQDDPADRRKFPIVTSALIIFPSFLAAFMLTFVGDPPLATVDIDGSRGVKGALLTHADGYWYVFNKKGKLVAVPDDGVTDVNICRPTTGKAESNCTQTSQDHEPAQPVRKNHPAV